MTEPITGPSQTSKWLFYAGFLFLAAFAAYLRVVDSEARPLHSDESVNFLFMENFFRDGGYSYSHENYHGPLYFFAMALGMKIFGDGVMGLRAASIFFGVLLLLPLLPLRGLMGKRYVLFAGILLAISPSLIFHSRYAIHETLLVAATLWFAVSAFLLWVTFEGVFAVMMMAATGVMISTKETWIVTAAAVAFGLLLAGRPFSRLAKVLERRQALFGGFLVCLAVILLCFTNGLQSGAGLHEFFLAIPQWVGRGHKDIGHFKPWAYYLKSIVWVSEPHLLIGAGAAVVSGILLAFFPGLRERSASTPVRMAFLRFLFGWSVVVVAIYSYIPYKTPWLIINLTLPLILLTAMAVSELADSPNSLLRAGGVLGFLAAVLISARSASIFCYSSPRFAPDELLKIEKHLPYGEGNPFSYVHTSPTLLNLVSDIFKYWKAHPKARVLVGVDGYFPLPYYLRHGAKQLAYLKTKDPKPWKDQYDVIIVEQTVKYDDPNFEMRYYRLSDYAETNTYFKK